VYKKGAENKIVDALSRRPSGSSDEFSCHSVSLSQPRWLSEIMQSCAQDPYA
jgi:hypothetical protein